MLGDTVVAIDGSQSSRRAIRVAAAISDVLGGRLDVVCFTRGPMSRSFRRQVHRLANEEGPTVPMHVAVDLQHGPAEQSIAAYIRTHPAQLVCMAAHGRSRSPAVLGSATEAVVRSTQRPVLLVGPSVRTVDFDPNGPVLLASTAAEPSAVAQGWSSVFGGEVFLTTLERAAAAAADRGAAVIVAPLGRQSTISRLVRGSELADVIHDASCPVITVASAEPDASGSEPTGPAPTL